MSDARSLLTSQRFVLHCLSFVVMNFRAEKGSPFIRQYPKLLASSSRAASVSSSEDRTLTVQSVQSPLAHSLRGYLSPGVYTRDSPHSLSGAIPGRISPPPPPPPPPQRALEELIR